MVLGRTQPHAWGTASGARPGGSQAYVPCAAKGSRLDRGGVRSQLATLPAAADGTAQLALRLTLQLVSRRGSLMEERIKGFLTSI